MLLSDVYEAGDIIRQAGICQYKSYVGKSKAGWFEERWENGDARFGHAGCHLSKNIWFQGGRLVFSLERKRKRFVCICPENYGGELLSVRGGSRAIGDWVAKRTNAFWTC